jgi:hypothetical protein
MLVLIVAYLVTHVSLHASSAAVWIESPHAVLGVTWYSHNVLGYFNYA